MILTHAIPETRQALRPLGAVALVPTMGALHTGHAALIRRARQLADHVVVSIFVNPAQFNHPDDLRNYPRPIEADLDLCRREGVSLVFQPSVEQMYPAEEPVVTVDVPAMSATLEGAHRPGHFQGVCRVVAKLFNIAQPAVACFGKKDYQQLAIIEAMTQGLCLPLRIERCETVRDPDGLACSSRNVRLQPGQRAAALGLSAALRHGLKLIADGQSDPDAVESAMAEVMTRAGVRVDYAAVRTARGLRTVRTIDPRREPVVCLVAGSVGQVRLIDNMEA